MIDFLSRPWPWYIGGPLLGLMVPILLLSSNKHFGVSSSFRHICAAVLKPKAEYFSYNWKDQAWNLAMVAGLIVGAAIAVVFLGGRAAPPISDGARALFASWGITEITELQPRELFGAAALPTARTLVTLVFGGFLIGFGTRYADGCTSGHAVMGLSLLNVGSLVAVIGFFIGGVIASNFIVPLVMAL